MTVLRLRRPGLVEPTLLGSSQAFFPLVGLLLGGLLAAAGLGLREAGASGQLSGWLLVALLLLLTGALHADGLADSADGLFAAGPVSRRLDIMRDPAVGAFGVAALIVVMALKATALGELVAGEQFHALMLAPCLSRWSCVAAIAVFPYARRDGLGSAFHTSSFPWAAPAAAAGALAVSALTLGPAGAAAWLLATALGLELGAAIATRLGGLTGDAYGAVVEVSEALLLLAALAWY
jgi:adenosylcobinamide-GDP ribazoletransferase